jgi:drug/metabolite transporter (DMT)-like permease
LSVRNETSASIDEAMLHDNRYRLTPPAPSQPFSFQIVFMPPSGYNLPRTMLKSLPASTQAVLIAILAYGSFSNADVINKLLTLTYTIPTILMVGSLIGLVTSSIWIFLGRGLRGFVPQTWKMHLLRGAIVAVSSYGAVGGIKHLPLPAFYSIVFLAPIAVILLSSALGFEKFYRHRFYTVLLGFAGVLVIVGPQFHEIGLGTALTMLCVIGSAVSILMVRKIGKDNYLPVYCFFPFLMIFLFSAPFATWDMPLPPLPDILKFLGFSLFIFVGHIAIPTAYARAPQASLIAPVFYTQILWGIFYGIVIFDQMPKPETLIGATLIISGGLYMIWKEKRYKHFPMNTEIIIERDFD